ncbi:SPRY domain-containing protein 3 [Phytophthora pseudosyringae]|uniref:SPRY domain-containing protein 3 n=1 Tax=Phytophthora pseudosyringae TaxID=221518 RepID=A0A8T1W0P8_9STRA|nr:SPRY domain-containing protein 3 [Phytophthora pseudosyringae]
MCQARRPSLKRAACRLTTLDDALLHRILRFLSARDVEALAVAARVVSRSVLPRFPGLWRALFAQRWATLNFPLAADATLAIEPKLRALFPAETTESRVLQLLAHAIVPVPSYADLGQTRRCQGYSDAKHQIEPLHDADTRPSHVVRFAFNGDELGDDRSVRANVPFPPGFHVAVFKRREAGKDGKPLYQIGLVASGYFEIIIVRREGPMRDIEEQDQHTRPVEEELTSLGLVPASFPLVGRQPGWNQKSFGYHGDDGRFYRQTTRGRLFGPRYGVNDTVGCGVRRNMGTAQSHVFFTSNGVELSRVVGGDIESPHTSWYPAVGVDSYNEVRVNFGQEPFAHDDIVDELFAECDPSVVATTDLPWHYIREYSIECLVWRRQQASEARARVDSDEWKDAISEKGKLEQEEETCMKKWMMGMLTPRQQNRLASSEENANEERAAARQLPYGEGV